MAGEVKANDTWLKFLAAAEDQMYAEMNTKLERAFQAAKREAESFGLTMPATVESLKLEKVRAVEMPIAVTGSGVFP